MVKIKGDPNRVPGWLKINRTMVPDFVVKDPEQSPVWEITGAEFSKAELHTASGISIRFPRVTRIRIDKTVETATNLQELEELYRASKQHMDIDLGRKSLYYCIHCLQWRNIFPSGVIMVNFVSVVFNLSPSFR